MSIAVPLLVAFLLGVPILYATTSGLTLSQRRWLFSILLTAFAVRVALSMIFAAFPETRIFHDDAEGTEIWSMRVASYWLGDGVRYPDWAHQDRNYGLIYVFGAVLYVFGRFPLNITIFNSLIGTLTVGVVYRIGLKLFHDVVARRAAFLTAFFPSMIIWSSIALKDPLMSFMICLTVLNCIRLRDKLSAWSFIGTLAPIVAAYPIRFYLVYFMAAAVVGTMILNRRGRFLAGFSNQALLAGGLVVLLVVFGFAHNASEDMQYFDLQKVSDYRHGMVVTANSSFAENADVSTPLSALLFLPIGLTTLIWGPFPWQMRSLRPLLTLPEMLIWWYMAPALIRGFWFAGRKRFTIFSPVIVFAGSMLIAYSLTMGNIGAAFRMRAQIFNLLFLFVALGQYLKVVKQRNIDVNYLIHDSTAEVG